MRRSILRALPSPGGGASAILGFLMLLAIWWAATALLQLRPVILPSPVTVGQKFLEMAASGTLTTDILVSLRELLWGFLIGCAAGLLSGIVLADSGWLSGFLEPIVETFRFVIPFSLVPLVVVWFGVSVIGKIFVVAYACYFVMAINTASAIKGIDPLVLKAARMLGVSGWQLRVRVILPAALPRILTGLQLALAYAWVSVIAAEYVGASAGLGYLITNAEAGLETARVMAGMVVIGFLGFVFSAIVGALRQLLVPYAEDAGW